MFARCRHRTEDQGELLSANAPPVLCQLQLINCIDDTLHTFADTLVDRPVDQAIQRIHERYTQTLPLAAELHTLRQT
jgi:hypothetical protein